jgi:hypothetical protein
LSDTGPIWPLAVEGVQHDSFGQVAQRHIVIFRERLEELEEALLHADAGLDVHDKGFVSVYRYMRTEPRVRKWHQGCESQAGRSHRMCRNIKTLFNFDPPVTDDEVRAASLQLVRKITGFNKPSKANEAAFLAAIDEIAGISASLLHSLDTTAPPKNREEEAARAKARAAERFGA